MPMVSAGPWPLGQDTVSPPTSVVFQSITRDRPTAPRLVRAVNVDIDNQGWVTRRAGTTARVAGTALQGAFSGAGLLLVQDGGAIYRVTPGTPYTATALVTDLSDSARVSFVEWDQDTVFWTNGETGGRITSAGAAEPWGLAVPAAPTLSAETGTLAAGTYRVVCTLEDAQGREHGATPVAEITLAASKKLVVDLASVDPAATHVNVYASPGPEQEALLWCARVAVADLPVSVSSVSVSARECRTQFLRGPIWGAGLAVLNGYLLAWRDGVVFRSRGQVPHLFHPRELMQFDEDVRGVVGLKGGAFVATARGMFWVSAGGPPSDWGVQRLDFRRYAAGCGRVGDGVLGGVDAGGEAAVFASEDGLVIGLSGGGLKHATQDRMRLDVGSARVQFAVRSLDHVDQLLMLVT